jgi:hypothetical protein
LKKTHLVALRVTVVTGWYIFKPKIPIWVNFVRSCHGGCWHIKISFGIFTVVWYILWLFGTCSPFLYQEKSCNPAGHPDFSIHSRPQLSLRSQLYLHSWHITFGLFYAHLVYIFPFWYIFSWFGISFPGLVYFFLILVS